MATWGDRLIHHWHLWLHQRVSLQYFSRTMWLNQIRRLLHFKHIRITWIIQILNNPHQFLLRNTNMIKKCRNLTSVKSHFHQTLYNRTLPFKASYEKKKINEKIA